jgi:hypothetical protein
MVEVAAEAAVKLDTLCVSRLDAARKLEYVVKVAPLPGPTAPRVLPLDPFDWADFDAKADARRLRKRREEEDQEEEEDGPAREPLAHYDEAEHFPNVVAQKQRLQAELQRLRNAQKQLEEALLLKEGLPGVGLAASSVGVGGGGGGGGGFGTAADMPEVVAAPSPWVEAYDESGGVYFYNNETGESSYDTPAPAPTQ